MPRREVQQSFLNTLKRQAAKTVESLQWEIARRAKELAMLKEEAARWATIIGRQPYTTNAAASRRRARKKGPRLDWNAILAALPPIFAAQDVARKTGKPMEQVYAGVSRWTKDKKIKKSKNGYRKAASTSAAHSQEKNGQAVSA